MRALECLLCALLSSMLLFVYSILRLPLVLDILVLHPYDASPNYVLSSAQHNFVHLVVNEFEIVFCTPY